MENSEGYHRNFMALRCTFKKCYEAVKKGHAKSPRQHQGHGFDHDVAVAQMTLRIAPDGRTASKAWVAALLHSTDHVSKKGRLKTTLRRYLKYLPSGHFSAEELEEIFVAALRHNEKNKDDDSLTLKVLKDADRLVCLDMTVVIRSGQFWSKIPVIDLEYVGRMNPASRYRAPRSSLDNLRSCLEWVDWFRLPRAKYLGRKAAAELQDYIERCERMYCALGLAGVRL